MIMTVIILRTMRLMKMMKMVIMIMKTISTNNNSDNVITIKLTLTLKNAILMTTAVKIITITTRLTQERE